jgi:hypothetical protein
VAGCIIDKKILPKFWFTFHLHPIVFCLLALFYRLTVWLQR